MPNMPFSGFDGVCAGAPSSAPTGSASTGTPPLGFGSMLTSLTFFPQVRLQLHPVLDAQLLLPAVLDRLDPLGPAGLVRAVRRRHGTGRDDRQLALGAALFEHLAPV